MTPADKALTLGCLSICLVAFAGASDTVAPTGITVSARGALPYRLLALGSGPETSTTIIEQPDGLTILDDSLAPSAGMRAVARIRALSDRPVRFLVYRHDHGDRAAQDRAFRQAWPDIIIVSTEAEGAAAGPALTTALRRVEELGQMALDRLDLTVSLRSTLSEILAAGDSVIRVYDRLVQTRLTVSAVEDKGSSCGHNG